MRALVGIERGISLVGLSLGLLLGALPADLSAQSLTSGSLRGSVQTADGSPVSGAAVTVESRGGGTVASLTSDGNGEFFAQLLAPGEYRVLVEQIGFQPVRTSGVLVTAGTVTALTVTVERKPPPITSVTEVSNPGARAGGAAGTVVTGSALGAFDRPSDLGGVGRNAPAVIAAGDPRDGLGLGAGGLDFSHSRLFVDGVRETLLRHAGLPSDPPGAPVFSRTGLSQVQFLNPAGDLEWRGGPGTLVSAQTRSGGGRFRVAPYASFATAKLGQQQLDNPGDSTASSFQLGASLSGSIVPDTASIFLDIGFESLLQPSAAPWAHDSTRFRGAAGSLAELVPGIAADSFATELSRYAAGTVRSWKGGHAQGRLDWQLGSSNHLQARLGFVSWKETNPLLGADLFAGTGTSLTARDLSGAAGITTSGTRLANEFRLGFNLARRQWSAGTLPGTIVSGDGIGFGTGPLLPAVFDVKRLDVSDAVQYSLGRHLLKGGASFGLTSYQQDYRFGATGLYTFGDLDHFASGTGTFFQVTGPKETARFTVAAPSLFLQDTWSASSEIQIQGGVRYDLQNFPKSKIAADTAWEGASGIANTSVPSYKAGISPRASFVWNVQNQGLWIVRGSAGLYRGELDPALFAEAILFDGAATVRRGQGAFPNWPDAPDGSAAPTVGKRLTLFSPGYKSPRSTKFDLGLARSIRGAIISVGGSYGHTDFLMRRQDLNRTDAGARATEDGRPVFGTLVQQGALVSAAPKSNRRFQNYDLVSGLAPTGFVDHYELSATIERPATRGLSLEATYTYGRTSDNLVGLLQPDPADQLDPFPSGLAGGGDWSSGRSDLDVPHRVAAAAQFRTGGKTPIGFGVRWRWRSGLPFTPGFRPGVDLNADGGGNNDPVFVNQELEIALGSAGCSVVSGAFADRNSCRGPSAQALDLHLRVGLPLRIGAGGGLLLVVDGFNLLGSKTGVVDRAAQLVDATGSITPGPGGKLVLPLVRNANFGSLLSRRVEPRLIRFGLRMEY